MSLPLTKKRILIFSTAYLPLIGGAELAVKEITARLPEYDFVLITARLQKKLPSFERIGNVAVYRVGNGAPFDKYWLIWQGPRLAARLGQFAAVWAIMASYAGFAALRMKKKQTAIPFLLTLQEGDSRFDIYKHVWWCWPYFKQIFTRANYVQAISTYLAAWAKKLGAQCPIDVVPNGVTLSWFDQPAIDRGVNRQALGIPPDAAVVITVSRLEKKNGVAVLIRAMALLPPITHLIIVGSGSEAVKLKKLALDLGLNQINNERVHFIGGIPQADVAHYLDLAEVFCRPSVSEGLGNAFLEAMAANVPVVGTNVGGIPDFLHDGVTGLICEKNNPVDIAAKIQRLITEPALAESLRQNGRELVQARYGWDRIAGEMKDIFTYI